MSYLCNLIWHLKLFGKWLFLCSTFACKCTEIQNGGTHSFPHVIPPTQQQLLNSNWYLRQLFLNFVNTTNVLLQSLIKYYFAHKFNSYRTRVYLGSDLWIQMQWRTKNYKYQICFLIACSILCFQYIAWYSAELADVFFLSWSCRVVSRQKRFNLVELFLLPTSDIRQTSN